jgi:haloalkane dehalogenase
MTHLAPAPPWLDVAEYPFEFREFTVDGIRMHYIDEGKGETLLFVHGTPSWSFDFRHVIKALRPKYRCVAVDHIGFGLSDKPADYPYDTRRHSENLEKLVLGLDLRDITLVVHDFGGPIGLNMAIRHPERIRRLVILNSWLWSSVDDPDFIRMKKTLRSPLLPFLYKRLNISPRLILPASFGEHKLPKRLRRQYTSPFGNAGEREGALAFARSLLDDQDWFEELWRKRAAITEKPTLLIWGMKDPVIKAHHLGKFMSGFPDARVLRLESCGHFPQEEEPAQVIAATARFMDTEINSPNRASIVLPPTVG